MADIFSKVDTTAGTATDPGPLPKVAIATDGRTFSDLAGQVARGDLSLPDLAALFGLWPATVSETPYDPATEAPTALVMTLDRKAKTVAAVRGKRDLTAEEIAAREAERNPVPEQVSSAQASIILNDDGLLDRVDAIVAGMHRSVQLWYARANFWERNSPYVVGIGLMLGLTDADLDDKFRRAARRL